MWAVVINIAGERVFKKFELREDADKYYERAKIIQVRRPDARVAVISRVKPIPRDGSPRPKKGGYYWCPYCGTWRRFLKDYSYLRCEYCGVSDAEFDVKKHNPGEFKY